ncbi:TGACG-sequence-specific DNA-binding protein TGA-2.1-like [Rutidosis leptorrhynchoides]|uniref:TGACG-sequence-specific DNA-binding protein TGA-2.1-like n=1 Tax=Rutidosis leptorrhynchoides TaxID=125765 RepID=UPI003A991810
MPQTHVVLQINYGGAFDSQFKKYSDGTEMEYCLNNLANFQLCNIIKFLEEHIPDHHKDVWDDSEYEHSLSNLVKSTSSQFLLREFASKDDVLNLLYGTWMTPAELCVMWLGGFRPSDVVNFLNIHLQLTPEQSQFLINLKNDTFKQETDLSKQFTQLQSTLSSRFVGEAFRQSCDDMYVSNYMSQMHISMGNLRAMEEIMQKADRLRAIPVDKIHSRFIKKQFAMALLAINAYLNRITALSYMWISRPKS